MEPGARVRTVTIDRQRADTKRRRVPCTLSSETPVRTYWGIEVLGHGPEEVDLSRVRNGRLPLLDAHDTRTLPRPGNLIDVHLEGRTLKATLELSDTPRGLELWKAIESGYLEDVSVGYNVASAERAGTDEETGLPIMRATKWTPTEGSLVNVGADPAAGVGRSSKYTYTEETMEKEQELEQAPAVRSRKPQSVEEERARVAEINALARHWESRIEGAPALADQAIRQGWSDERFGRKLLEMAAAGDAPLVRSVNDGRSDGQFGIGTREMQGFSLTRAILALTTKDWRSAGKEREVCDHLSRSLKRDTEGILVPLSALNSGTRTLNTGGAGGYLVPERLLTDQYIAPLQNASMVLAAGAMTLPNLDGNISIPRGAGSTSTYWVGESGDVTASEYTPGQVSGVPKTVGILSELSRRMLIQGQMAETILRKDISDQLGLAVDLAALAGTGGAQPLGILNTPGVGSVTTTGALSWDGVVDFLGGVSVSNAMSGRMAWMINALTMARLLKTPKDPGSGVFLMDPPPPGVPYQGIIAGYPAYVTNQVPANLGAGANLSAMFFGNWADVVIAEWGVLEILADPYTKFASGDVRIRGLMDCDVLLRHPASFAVAVDVDPEA